MPKSSQYKHIIWDWNGTLLNDGWLFVDVMNSILRQRKMETITLEKYRNIFGFPIKDYYIKLGFDLEKESFFYFRTQNSSSINLWMGISRSSDGVE